MQGRCRTSPAPSTVVNGVLAAALVVWATAGAPAGDRLVAGALIAAGGLVSVWFGPRMPFIALAVAFVVLFAAGSQQLTEDPFLAGLVWASFLVGRHASLRQQPWAGAGVLLLLSANVVEPRDTSAADVVFPVLLTAGPWLLGLTVQVATRRERAAVAHADRVVGQRDVEVKQATAEERLRIAQELHDVVAHTISAVSLQAQVARRAAEAGQPVDVGLLRSVEHTAQQVMADVRRLLGVLRVDDEAGVRPVPDLRDLDTLLEECRRLGQQIELVSTGTARILPPALSAAAYRIVQESLTNARRHGTSGSTRMHLDWAEHTLTVEVENPVDTDAQDGSGGHGLVGITERARLFGGAARAGRAGGAWVVHVELPLPAGVVEPAW